MGSNESAPLISPEARVAVLAHDQFPDRAKTALGVLRYADYDVVAVLDQANAGRRVNEFVTDVSDAPIVADMAAVPDCDALIIGIAPIGGDFEPDWRPDVRAALNRGCDVVAGLHYQLAGDAEFSELAADSAAELYDIRDPPDGLTVAAGTAHDVDATVVLTVGTDCSTGKMTTTLELARAARSEGHSVGVVPTGQTGILVEGWGIAIDRVIADFAAGAVESLVHDAATGNDLVIVEGQGSIIHPAYSGVTCSILHGAMPDALVLCHIPGREEIHGYERTDIPAAADLASLYESLARPVHPAPVIAGSLATHELPTESAARTAVDRFRETLGVPATDPVRFDATPLLEGLK